MLGKIFLKIWDMSIWGSYSIFVVLTVRMLLRRSDRKFAYCLWLVAFFNLCIPFSIKGSFSLFPAQLMELPAMETKDSVSDKGIDENWSIHNTSYVLNKNSMSTMQAAENKDMTPLSENEHDKTKIKQPATKWLELTGMVWLFGVLCFLLYNIVSIWKLQRKIGCTYGGREIQELADIDTPFLWGILHPVIYMPKDTGQEERTYLTEHELCHKQRKDHIMKPILYSITVLHWFNPLVWVAYRLCVRDMEISCDEMVLSKAASMGGDIKKQYAESLLRYAVKQSGYIITPITFGEPSVKERIKNILHYHKKGTFATGFALVCVLVVTAGLIFRPHEQNPVVVEAQEDKTQTEQPQPSVIFLTGYTGYLDAYTNWDGHQNFTNCDYDGDGLIDRVFREELPIGEMENQCNWRIEFGNGDLIELNNYLDDFLIFNTADLTGNGTQEIIISGCFASSTDPCHYGVCAVFEKKENGYEPMVLPFEDSGEYGNGAKHVTPCIKLRYEVTGGKVHISSDKPQIEESVWLNADIQSDLAVFGYSEENKSAESITYPYAVETVNKDGTIGLKFYFEAFGKYSDYRIIVLAVCQNGEMQTVSYTIDSGSLFDDTGEADNFINPCEYQRISNDYGQRTNPITKETISHNGIDFAAELGTPILAVMDGIVDEAGFSSEEGNYIIVRHENGLCTHYAHCKELTVEQGSVVKQGEVIATVGSSGKSTGAHLHFAISYESEYLNPWEYLPS